MTARRATKSRLRRVSLQALAALLLAWFLADTSLAETLVLDKHFPIHLEEVEVHLKSDSGHPRSGAEISVTYRPGSQVAHTDSIGISSADGSIAWTPAAAGIATLRATWTEPDGIEQSTSTNVSVRFSSLPFDGIVIMIVAGLLLIVGSAVRMYKVIKSPDFVQ